ncbi:vacuolar-type H+-ATPase subunit E/Vma4 [Catenibacillus scindens]|uniref:Vacuolar-type H+-ATPase subunit E/Vma4 n=1 Tax=Catenibacillus scindens TaxID=673271 RepID=A0A7W8M597_9FIRM|nr:V-type ATP synthase subunit E [Catenibacillus scindens]MBB5264699.1 vacuolar-type H+-ATPase subunit E/Vma4 [Catenibacillus scindens]
MTLEEKLELFKDSAIAEASHQGSVMLAQYRQSLEKIYNSKIEQVKKEGDSYIVTQTDKIRREHNRLLSMEQNKIKRDIGEKHHQVKEKIFSDVTDMLVEYKKDPEYIRSLEVHIRKILAMVENHPVTIYVDASDSGLIPELEQRCRTKISVSSQDFIGGIRAEVPSKNILIDYSYATRLEEEKNNFKI